MARDICVQFGKRIRELRRERDWRQLDLAEQAGISENYISELEQGRKEICLRTLERLADALEVKISDLMRAIGR
jgi:transcriptional regulator with XRE-family HTH domain